MQMSRVAEGNGLCRHTYLIEAFASLLVLTPQAVGAAQVEEHHGPSWGHATGVKHRRLLAWFAQTHKTKDNFKKCIKLLLKQGIRLNSEGMVALRGYMATDQHRLTRLNGLVSFVRSWENRYHVNDEIKLRGFRSSGLRDSPWSCSLVSTPIDTSLTFSGLRWAIASEILSNEISASAA